MTILDGYSPRWVEIDIDAIRHNLQEVRQWVGPDVKIMAVVKADAYGCGAPVVSRALVEQGVEWLAVTTIDEGIELRKKGIEARILVFSPLLSAQLRLAVDYELTPTVNSEATAWALAQAARDRGKLIRAHLKLETGMGRNGLFPAEAISLMERLADQPHLEIEGLYTHLAAANSPRQADFKYTMAQYEGLQQTAETLNQRGIRIPLRHVCNSAGLLAYPQLHLDMVRPGTILYGQYPSATVQKRLNLIDPWRLKAKIIQVKDYPSGRDIGYGRTFTTRRPSRIAVLPVGYVDGYTIEPVLKPQGVKDLIKVLAKDVLSYLGVTRAARQVKVEGKRVPVIGKVAMQSCMIDVTGQPGIEVGAVVEMSARRTTINRQLPKVYLKAGLPYLIATPDGKEQQLYRQLDSE